MDMSSRRNLDHAFPLFAPGLPSVYERAGFDVNKGDSSAQSVRSGRSAGSRSQRTVSSKHDGAGHINSMTSSQGSVKTAPQPRVPSGAGAPSALAQIKVAPLRTQNNPGRGLGAVPQARASSSSVINPSPLSRSFPFKSDQDADDARSLVSGVTATSKDDFVFTSSTSLDKDVAAARPKLDTPAGPANNTTAHARTQSAAPYPDSDTESDNENGTDRSLSLTNSSYPTSQGSDSRTQSASSDMEFPLQTMAAKQQWAAPVPEVNEPEPYGEPEPHGFNGNYGDDRLEQPFGLGVNGLLAVQKPNVNRFSSTSSIYTPPGASAGEDKFPSFARDSRDFASPDSGMMFPPKAPQHTLSNSRGYERSPLAMPSAEPTPANPTFAPVAPLAMPSSPSPSQSTVSSLKSTIPSVAPLSPQLRGSAPSAQPQGGNTSSKICRGCLQPIVGKSIYSKDGNLTGRWHRTCFKCTRCTLPLSSEVYVLNDSPYCQECYHITNQSTCRTCGLGIEGDCLETFAEGEEANEIQHLRYHIACHKCSTCNTTLFDSYYALNGKSYCVEHGNSSFLGVTSKAQKRVTRLMMI